MEEDDPYVRVVEGSVSNVIGLPLETLRSALEWIRNGMASRERQRPEEIS